MTAARSESAREGADRRVTGEWLGARDRRMARGGEGMADRRGGHGGRLGARDRRVARRSRGWFGGIASARGKGWAGECLFGWVRGGEG